MKNALILLAFLVCFSSCKKEAIDGKNSLMDLMVESPGVNCAAGGYKINVGIDFNGNNILDPDEIQYTEFICNGVDGFYDRQIRLSILSLSSGTTSTTGEIVGNLPKFDKNYWDGVDSIIFVTDILINKYSFFTRDENNNIIEILNPGFKAFAELYDKTNNVVIENSLVQTDKNEFTRVETGNILNYLPAGEVEIAILLRTENDQFYAHITGNSFLILYRK